VYIKLVRNLNLVNAYLTFKLYLLKTGV